MRDPYLYQGPCPYTGELLCLERNRESEAAAIELMQTLPELAEGKMFGVLLTAEGAVLRAFSGLQERSGWAPPIYRPDPGSVPEELDRLKYELQKLAGHPAFAQLAEARAFWQQRLEDFQHQCRLAKAQRDEQRRRGLDSRDLVLQSQREGTAHRKLRSQRQDQIQPLERQVADLQQKVLELKRHRKELSAELQRQMHQELSSCLAAGQPWSLASLFPAGPPTGTGECCAPKLLYQAASLGLTPVGLAEFWWGPAQGSRQPGQFYAACQERCQPLIGPLLARFRPLEVLYQDDSLLAVVKPPGVLTVPGRHSWNQDSLWLRLKQDYPTILPIHRLDLETSGVCLWALTPECQRDLQHQLAERLVDKCYEALLSRQPPQTSGVLDQSLGPDPLRPGTYRIDPRGKPSHTDFHQVEGVRYQFYPRTGRSHQIRVHTAQGLCAPICGDRLYGGGEGPLRLHARWLRCQHRGQTLHLEANVPF